LYAKYLLRYNKEVYHVIVHFCVIKKSKTRSKIRKKKQMKERRVKYRKQAIIKQNYKREIAN